MYFCNQCKTGMSQDSTKSAFDVDININMEKNSI